MTATLDRPVETTPEQRIPAWGISVDLTPREVVLGRRTRVVQRLVALGLVLVVLACAGAFLLAQRQRASAQTSYGEAQAQTSALQAASHDFDGLVQVQQVTQQTDAVAGQLLAQDVDVVNLLARIRSALPADVTISSLAAVAAPVTTGAVSSGTTATGDAQPIGTVTISGGGVRIKALAPFVARLNHMKGIADVVPTTTTQTEDGMVYSLTMAYTSDLYTHRFPTTSSTTGTTSGTTTGTTTGATGATQ